MLLHILPRNEESISQSFSTTTILNIAKLLSKLRTAIDVLEKKMTTKQWSEIDYQKVPSVAGLKYRGAFSRNDEARYGKYLEDVASGKKKINASTLYPYDIVRKFLGDYGGIKRLNEQEVQSLNAMWDNLPNYLSDNPHRGLVVCDTSGSMYGGGGIAPIEVSISLAMYIAERKTILYLEMRFLHFQVTHNFKEFRL